MGLLSAITSLRFGGRGDLLLGSLHRVGSELFLLWLPAALPNPLTVFDACAVEGALAVLREAET
jgi:hypothetical protein